MKYKDIDDKYWEFINFQLIAFLLKKLMLIVFRIIEDWHFHSDLKPSNIIFKVIFDLNYDDKNEKVEPTFFD